MGLWITRYSEIIGKPKTKKAQGRKKQSLKSNKEQINRASLIDLHKTFSSMMCADQKVRVGKNKVSMHFKDFKENRIERVS